MAFILKEAKRLLTCGLALLGARWRFDLGFAFMVHFLSIVADIQGCPLWPVFQYNQISTGQFVCQAHRAFLYKRFAGFGWSGLRFPVLQYSQISKGLIRCQALAHSL